MGVLVCVDAPADLVRQRVPDGAAREAEYVEIGLTQACDGDRVRDALDSALPPGLDALDSAPPPGLDVLEVVVAPTGALADLLTRSRWEIRVVGVDPVVMTEAVHAFLAEESVEVQRLTKNGIRAFDARAAVVQLTAVGDRVELVIRHTEPLVRPDDVLNGLTLIAPQLVPAQVPILTRISQGVLDVDTAEIGDPFRP